MNRMQHAQCGTFKAVIYLIYCTPLLCVDCSRSPLNRQTWKFLSLSIVHRRNSSIFLYHILYICTDMFSYNIFITKPGVGWYSFKFWYGCWAQKWIQIYIYFWKMGQKIEILRKWGFKNTKTLRKQGVKIKISQNRGKTDRDESKKVE